MSTAEHAHAADLVLLTISEQERRQGRMQKPRLPLHAVHADSLGGGQGEAQEFVRDIDAGRDEGDCVCSMREQGLDRLCERLTVEKPKVKDRLSVRHAYVEGFGEYKHGVLYNRPRIFRHHHAPPSRPGAGGQASRRDTRRL